MSTGRLSHDENSKLEFMSGPNYNATEANIRCASTDYDSIEVRFCTIMNAAIDLHTALGQKSATVTLPFLHWSLSDTIRHAYENQGYFVSFSGLFGEPTCDVTISWS